MTITISQHVALNELTSQHLAFTELISQHVALNELISQHVALNELISQHVALNELISQHVALNELIYQHIAFNKLIFQHVAFTELIFQQVAASKAEASSDEDDEPLGKRLDRKVSVRRPLTEAELRDQDRWRWACREGGRWELWTRESDDVWRQRFEVRESGLMRAAMERNPAYGTEPSLGLFAARDLEKGEKVGALVGEDIGRAEGEEANRAILDRIAQGRGRHIVEVRRGGSARLLDAEGAAGYTGMQFVNDARRMRGWRNNMEFREDGIVTALQRILVGTELLFAYDKGGQGGYWRTWGKKGERTRARSKQGVTQKKEQMAEPSPILVSPPAKQEAEMQNNLEHTLSILNEQEQAAAAKEQAEAAAKRSRDDWALAASLAVGVEPRCVCHKFPAPTAACSQTHISAPCIDRTHISAR